MNNCKVEIRLKKNGVVKNLLFSTRKRKFVKPIRSVGNLYTYRVCPGSYLLFTVESRGSRVYVEICSAIVTDKLDILGCTEYSGSNAIVEDVLNTLIDDIIPQKVYDEKDVEELVEKVEEAVFAAV